MCLDLRNVQIKNKITIWLRPFSVASRSTWTLKFTIKRSFSVHQTLFLYVNMDTLMAIEISWLREPLIANIALVRFLASVSAHVLGERGAVREGLGTNTASVRAFAIVSAHVRGDGGRLGELTAANVTLKWLFTGVNAKMCREIGSLWEGLEANQTLIWLFTTVRAQMQSQGRQSRIRFSAYGTFLGAIINEVLPGKHSGGPNNCRVYKLVHVWWKWSQEWNSVTIQYWGWSESGNASRWRSGQIRRGEGPGREQALAVVEVEEAWR